MEVHLVVCFFILILNYCHLTVSIPSSNRDNNGFEEAASETYEVPFWRSIVENSSDWNPTGRSYITDKRYLWPNARIPYFIDQRVGYNLRNKIQEYIMFFNQYTCVKWVPGSQNERNYVLFILGGLPCWSQVGCTNRGMQHINLNDACIMDTGHEMMHAMGFIHEHTRLDRECYVGIRSDMVSSNFNYQTYRHMDTESRFPYDYNSVMHYPALFGRNPIIWGHGPYYSGGACIGPFYSSMMTNIDIWKVNTLYCGKTHYCNVNPKECQDYETYERSCLNRNFG